VVGAGFLARLKKLNLSLLSMLSLPRLWLVEPEDSRLSVPPGVAGLVGVVALTGEMGCDLSPSLMACIEGIVAVLILRPWVQTV
jgi:hypothetical protein